MSTNTTNNTPKTVTKNEVVKNVRNIRLDGRKALKADEISVTFEVTRKINPKTGKPDGVVRKIEKSTQVTELTFNLEEISEEELLLARINKTPSFVLKENGKYYYSQIGTNLSFVSAGIIGPHRCAVAGHECRRLSAASDENGGCAKVRGNSTGIERYPWIKVGYETFNTGHDSFVVISCEHYEKSIPRPKMSTADVNAAKLGLAQFVWDDVTSQRQVKARIDRNHSRYGSTY